jgi:hypothetical protein
MSEAALDFGKGSATSTETGEIVPLVDRERFGKISSHEVPWIDE